MNIIHYNQNGFIPGRSTNRAIYQLLSQILNGINAGEDSLGIFMDLSRAFDSINHDILYKKLEYIGIRGNALELIRSYLTNRMQRVETTNEDGECIFSNWKNLQRGVPQGSILGPLIFIIYINDLPRTSLHPVILFADDSSMILRDKLSSEEDIARSLDHCETWFARNDLTLNVNKTNILRFSYFKKEPLNINYKSEQLTSADSVPFLGTTLDSQLNWKKHIDNLTSKVSSFNYALRVIVTTIDTSAALTAYFAYVHSRIRYGVIFWGVSVDAVRVFITQKKCLRTIFNLRKTETCKRVFVEKSILTLPCLYIYECAVFVKQHYTLFAEQLQHHGHNTRGKANCQLLPPQTKRTFIQKSVLTQIINIYNHLPVSLKNLDKKNFKKKLHSYLVKNAFYDVSDFYKAKVEDSLFI